MGAAGSLLRTAYCMAMPAKVPAIALIGIASRVPWRHRSYSALQPVYSRCMRPGAVLSALQQTLHL